MVGSDKNTDTSYNYLTQFYTPVSTNVTVSGGGTGDFYDSIQSIWNTFGLKSTASRILFALLMMFLTAIAYVLFMVAISSTSKVPLSVSAVVLMVLEFFEVLIFTYLGLIPLWIIVIIGIMGILVVVLFFITRARGG